MSITALSLGPGEEEALRPSSSPRMCSHPNGVSFCFRCPWWNLDPWIYELPDSHLDVKQFAFGVTASSNGFPSEEPLFWGSLNPNGHSRLPIRCVPVKEPHIR